MQSEVLALKGMSLMAAVAATTERQQPLTGQLTLTMRHLLHLIVTTMAANPLSTVRNAAYYALDAVLSACTVGPFITHRPRLPRKRWHCSSQPSCTPSAQTRPGQSCCRAHTSRLHASLRPPG